MAGTVINNKWMILRPACTIDIKAILRQWAEEWNESLNEDCTEKWELCDVSIMSGRNVALTFKLPEVQYVGNINKEIEKRVISNRYRVLVYNVDEGLKNKYRFKIQAGYSTDVHFINGCLNAAIFSYGSNSCTMLHMWPGSNDEAQKMLGENISCQAVSKDG